MAKSKGIKGQTTINKKLCRKWKNRTHQTAAMSSDASKELEVSATLVTSVLLFVVFI
jgi:hypothetical protein